MIIGAHSIIYSTNPQADRAFLRDVLTLPNVDVGEGWLIFGLPPAEVAVLAKLTPGVAYAALLENMPARLATTTASAVTATTTAVVNPFISPPWLRSSRLSVARPAEDALSEG